MAKRKLVRSNAEAGAYGKIQRELSEKVGLPTGLQPNSDKKIAAAAKKKGMDVPKGNLKAETTKIENRGKAKTAGLPVSKPKKKLTAQLRDIKKKKVRKNKKRKT